MDYLVLGLPRSRTSWLSFALGATHEYISSGGNVGDIPDGVGCVEINPYLDYPECKTVVIIRDPIEIAESLGYFYTEQELEEGFIEKECLLAHKKLIDVAIERDALVVKFDEIDEDMKEVIDYLELDIGTEYLSRLSLYRVEPLAEDLGNMFQFKDEFEDYFCGARDVNFTKELNPQVQSFEEWLAKNKSMIEV